MAQPRAHALLALLLCALCALLPPTRAVSWRLFAGREDCITEYMPESQWERVIETDPNGHDNHVLIDLGLIVTSRYGTEANRAAVDLTIYGPGGETAHKEDGISDTEVAVTAIGGRGPWKACFKVSRGQILRPSVLVKLTYFTVNQMSLVGTTFEWQRHGPTEPRPQEDPKSLVTREQVDELSLGLQRLDYYLHNVTNEQRYLYARTLRHLKTVQSTHTRAFWYYLLTNSVIVLSAFAQVVGIRMLFRNSRKQGFII